jgi:hypothetical protein
MDLKEFSSLIVSNATEAKNHISYLIGTLGSKDSVGKAILGLYDSFPDSYKDKALFTPVMLKFFGTYKVNKDNISYYNEFSPGWTASHIESVKKINPQWEWTRTEYKNSLEFSKAVSNSRDYQQPSKIFEFLEHNFETLQKLIQKDKNKLIINFSKQNCWVEMAQSNYDNFSKFCDKYQFNKIDILKTDFIDSYYGIDRLIFKYQGNDFIRLFNDLQNHDSNKLLENTHFLADRSKHNPNLKTRSGYSALDVVLRLIAEDKVEEADFLLQKFPDYIQQNFSYYSYKEKPVFDLVEGIGECVTSIVKLANERTHRYNLEPRELGNYSRVFEEKFKVFKEYVEVVKFKEQLENGISEKQTKSRQRKL